MMMFDQGEMVLPYKYMEPTAAKVRVVDGVRIYDDVEYALLRGFRPLVLDLAVPLTSQKPVPTIIYLHPGAWLTGSHKVTGAYRCMHPILSALVQSGFAVASVQYRLSSEAVFPACLNDAMAAVRWLRGFAAELGLDASKFASWGESAGGHLAAMLAMNITDPELTGSVGRTDAASTVQAGVSWYGTTDFLASQAQAIPGTKAKFDQPDAPGARLLGAAVGLVPQLARRASPVSWVSTSAAPCLFVHGDDDHITPPLQSVTLYEALRAAGCDARLTVVAGADHELRGVDPAPYIAQSIDFLSEHLLS